ncbi:MFS monocarboxylate transporter [Fusarium venenatum]|uniref:MFS monocarboxylate transporter n=1 Tax=Fusarium venenatum TaxID=56646 RepID=UPI001DD34974|nr:MFS monocarboxylate transporter [Fusarium venenatum]
MMGLKAKSMRESDSPAETMQSATIDLPVPPDGGYGWIQVLAAHLEVFNTFGYSYSFGIFEQYYHHELGFSLSSTSWIGSIHLFLLFILSTISGRLFDAGYFRHLLIVGSFLQILGLFMASISTEYWHLFLAQGVCSGIGAGLAYCPVMACVSTYFTNKRALAIAVVTSGSATGGIIFPIIAQQMMYVHGFPWTIRCMAFVILFNAIIVVALAKELLLPRKNGPFFEFAAFREMPFVLFSCGSFLILWSVFIGPSYINHYATSVVGISNETSLTILLTLNALSCPGRIIPSLISDAYLGPFRTLIPLMLSASVLYIGWLGVKNLPSVFVFASLFGFVCGGIQTVGMAGLPNLTIDHSKMGTRMGMILTMCSFAALTGPPIAGKLIEHGHGRYLYMQIWGACSMALGAGFIFAAFKSRPKGDN